MSLLNNNTYMIRCVNAYWVIFKGDNQCSIYDCETCRYTTDINLLKEEINKHLDYAEKIEVTIFPKFPDDVIDPHMGNLPRFVNNLDAIHKERISYKVPTGTRNFYKQLNIIFDKNLEDNWVV